MVGIKAVLYNRVMSLGQNIRKARIDAGLHNRSEFARRLGVSPQAAYNWEEDIDIPEGKNLILIAKECKTTVARLLDEQPGLSRQEEEWLKVLKSIDPEEMPSALRALRGFMRDG